METDGRRYHDNPVAQRNDAAKRAMLEAAGYRVLRVTWDQIRDQPRQTVQRIHRLLN